MPCMKDAYTIQQTISKYSRLSVLAIGINDVIFLFKAHYYLADHQNAVIQLQVSVGTLDSLNYAIQIDPEETGNYTSSLPTLPQVCW